MYFLWTLCGLCKKLCKSRFASDIVFFEGSKQKIRAFFLWKDLFHSKNSKDFLDSVESMIYLERDLHPGSCRHVFGEVFF